MYANINNIAYIESEGMYHIITEYSRLAVESFNTEDEAKLFMRGYLMNTDHTEAECKGKLFRNMIDIDMRIRFGYGCIIKINYKKKGEDTYEIKRNFSQLWL